VTASSDHPSTTPVPRADAKVVAIAGATGFVGSHLIGKLRGSVEVVGLTRAPRAPEPGVTFRECDLFSLSSAQAALRGVDVAFYLVHSMMPSSRLFQGDFHDTDLLLADNFTRGCAQAGVKQIVYLGGLVPTSGFVSKHLTSRLEVEEVLQSSGIPISCFRTGMVVGPGGSSFEILRSLVARLPWMVLPRWTKSIGQAIFLDDVLAVLAASIRDPALFAGTFDIVNGEALPYEDLLRQTAAALGKKRLMIPVPIDSTGFSKRWVQLFSGAPYELVSPLIDSLQCDLPAPPPRPEIAHYIQYTTFADMLAQTLRRSQVGGQSERASARPRAPGTRRGAPTVRSVQRLPALPASDARFISDEYIQWLPRFFHHFLRVDWVTETARVTFSLALFQAPLLVLELVDPGSDRSRDKFRIVGGLLSKTTRTGWLEFRQVANKRFTLAAIHEFVPSLPWLVYLVTQAPLHAWVMRRFGEHLDRLTRTR
jgi:uncharacterized protein YbjT (DUF2867 family)